MDSCLIRSRIQANLVLEQSAAFNLHFFIKEFVFWPKYNLYARVETDEGLDFFLAVCNGGKRQMSIDNDCDVMQHCVNGNGTFRTRSCQPNTSA